MLVQKSIDEEKILNLANTYGALDGENSYNFATHFSLVGNDVSETQMVDLMQLRDLDDFECDPSNIYVYSEKFAFKYCRIILRAYKWRLRKKMLQHSFTEVK